MKATGLPKMISAGEFDQGGSAICPRLSSKLPGDEVPFIRNIILNAVKKEQAARFSSGTM
jgi:hypothetical protein